MKIRQAMQAAINPPDMLAAAFGDPALFDLDGSIYGKGAFFYDGRNTQGFNQRDPKKAAQLLKEAGYHGEPIRLLTSLQFDYFYKQTLVAKEKLQGSRLQGRRPGHGLVRDRGSFRTARKDPRR